MGNIVQMDKRLAQHCATWRNRAAVARLHRTICAMRDDMPRNTDMGVQSRAILSEAIASLKAMRRLGAIRYVRSRI